MRSALPCAKSRRRAADVTARMPPMRALQTLRGRILAASLGLALLIGIAFVVLILAVRDTRDAARVAEQSQRVAAQANLLERLLLDLETGQRAYVITGRRSFLAPWDAALRGYPAAARELRALAVDPPQRRRVDHSATYASMSARIRSARRRWGGTTASARRSRAAAG